MMNGREPEDARSAKAMAGLGRWLLPTFIFLITLVPFYPSLENGFVNYDDNKVLLENPNYRGLAWTQLRWMLTTFHEGHYHPVTWMTFGLDYLLWGLNPFGYHLTSLLLHAANAVLFYLLALRLFSLALCRPALPREPALRMAAGFTALIFAIHPLRVESVAWATERRDVLSGLFFLWTILCYLRYAMGSRSGRSRLGWLVLSILVYGFSLLSKASGMALPIILWVLDIYPLRRLGDGPGRWFGPTVRQVWWEKIPFLLLAVGAGATALAAQHQAGALAPLVKYGAVHRLAQAFFGLIFYLTKTLLPFGLSPLYELPVQFNPWDRPFPLYGAMVVLVSAGLYLARRRWPVSLAIWICYVVLLAPVLGTAQSGPQIVADRYSYLSCLGWAILAGGGLIYLWKNWLDGHIGRRAFMLVSGPAAFVLVGLGVLTWRQAQVWHDSERLWRHVLTIDQNSSYAHYGLALVLHNQGMAEEAIAHFRQALRVNPRFAEAHNNLGIALGSQGKLEEATSHFREAVHINPTYAKAHFNLGGALGVLGRLEEAADHFREAVRIDPVYARAHYSLGNSLAGQGNLDAAIRHYREALRIQAEFAEAHENLGRALALQGKTDEAVKHYQEALRILKSRSSNTTSGP